MPIKELTPSCLRNGGQSAPPVLKQFSFQFYNMGSFEIMGILDKISHITKVKRSRSITKRVLGVLLFLGIGSVGAIAQEDPFAAAIRASGPKTPDDELYSFHPPPRFKIERFASVPEIQKPMNTAFDAGGSALGGRLDRLSLPLARLLEGEGFDGADGGIYANHGWATVSTMQAKDDSRIEMQWWAQPA